ncbi:hypothetical protein [Mycobacterium sp.]|uniref:hypothetical protein n=1 Tax=Mycobacterium sp. TaxID=1785 RepID=UPI003F99FE19
MTSPNEHLDRQQESKATPLSEQNLGEHDYRPATHDALVNRHIRGGEMHVPFYDAGGAPEPYPA